MVLRCVFSCLLVIHMILEFNEFDLVDKKWWYQLWSYPFSLFIPVLGVDHLSHHLTTKRVEWLLNGSLIGTFRNIQKGKNPESGGIQIRARWYVKVFLKNEIRYLVDPSFPKWSYVIIPVFLWVVRPSVICPSIASFFDISDTVHTFFWFLKNIFEGSKLRENSYLSFLCIQSLKCADFCVMISTISTTSRKTFPRKI